MREKVYTEEVTYPFERTNAMIEYKGGERETVEYVERWTENELVVLMDIRDEDWYAVAHDDGASIGYTSPEKLLVSTDVIKKITVQYKDQLIAVGNVKVTEEVDSGLFKSTTTYRGELEDIEIWFRDEWESENKDNKT